MDEAISREVLRAARPAALEASVLASQELGWQQDDVLDALHRDLEAARYAAERAQRQYDVSDPENRLVTVGAPLELSSATCARDRSAHRATRYCR